MHNMAGAGRRIGKLDAEDCFFWRRLLLMYILAAYESQQGFSGGAGFQ